MARRLYSPRPQCQGKQQKGIGRERRRSLTGLPSGARCWLQCPPSSHRRYQRPRGGVDPTWRTRHTRRGFCRCWAVSSEKERLFHLHGPWGNSKMCPGLVRGTAVDRSRCNNPVGRSECAGRCHKVQAAAHQALLSVLPTVAFRGQYKRVSSRRQGRQMLRLRVGCTESSDLRLQNIGAQCESRRRAAEDNDPRWLGDVMRGSRMMLEPSRDSFARLHGFARLLL
jgi:hypothetical protein